MSISCKGREPDSIGVCRDGQRTLRRKRASSGRNYSPALAQRKSDFGTAGQADRRNGIQGRHARNLGPVQHRCGGHAWPALRGKPAFLDRAGIVRSADQKPYRSSGPHTSGQQGCAGSCQNADRNPIAEGEYRPARGRKPKDAARNLSLPDGCRDGCHAGRRGASPALFLIQADMGATPWT